MSVSHRLASTRGRLHAGIRRLTGRQASLDSIQDVYVLHEADLSAAVAFRPALAMWAERAAECRGNCWQVIEELR